MEASNAMLFKKPNADASTLLAKGSEPKLNFNQQDKLAMGTMKFAQGVGATLRYANEMRAVQQVGRLEPFLKSSNLHQQVLRGNLSTGTSFADMFGPAEDVPHGFGL